MNPNHLSGAFAHTLKNFKGRELIIAVLLINQSARNSNIDFHVVLTQLLTGYLIHEDPDIKLEAIPIDFSLEEFKDRVSHASNEIYALLKALPEVETMLEVLRDASNPENENAVMLSASDSISATVQTK